MSINFIKNKKYTIDLLERVSELFEYKVIFDSNKTEYVVYKSSVINNIEDSVDDKTAFEAVENHVHLIDDIKKADYAKLIHLGNQLGKALLNNLTATYPSKRFVVFVTLTDSMIIRFHQKWENEPEYFTVDENSDDVVLRFTNI